MNLPIGVFDNRQKVLRKLSESGHELIRYFSGVPLPKICKEIGDPYSLHLEKIGSGNQGEVYEILDKGNRTPYVVKKILQPLEQLLFWVEDTIDLEEKLEDNYRRTPELRQAALDYNGLEEVEDFTRGSWVIFPKGIGVVGFQLPLHDGSLLESKKGLLCGGAYAELLLSLIAGSLDTPHIVQTFYTVNCLPPFNMGSYLFMERIDFSLQTAKKCFQQYPQALDNVIIPILFALLLLQEKFQIVHNDLHTDNIFLSLIKSPYSVGNKRIGKADYSHYRVFGVDLYLPYQPFVAKIGDLGFANKFSKPEVINYTSITNEFNIPKDSKIQRWFPERYEPGYDPLFMINAIRVAFPRNELIENFGKIYLREDWNYYCDKTLHRPFVEKIGILNLSAKEILTNKVLMKRYLQKPPANKRVVTMGTFQ